MDIASGWRVAAVSQARGCHAKDRAQVARSSRLGRSRAGLGHLGALDPKPTIIRYQREKLGELIHIDIKKLGRIDGIGHRISGDRTGQSNKRGTGWEYVHVLGGESFIVLAEGLQNAL